MGNLRLAHLESPTSSLLADIQRVCDETPDYFIHCEGRPATPGEAARWFAGGDLPHGYRRDDEFIHGIYLDNRLIGVSHVLRGWKRPDQSMIGLLLLSEKYQRQGHRPPGLLHDRSHDPRVAWHEVNADRRYPKRMRRFSRSGIKWASWKTANDTGRTNSSPIPSFSKKHCDHELD